MKKLQVQHSAEYCQYPTCVCSDNMDCPHFKHKIMNEVQADYNDRMPRWAQVVIAIALIVFLACIGTLLFI